MDNKLSISIDNEDYALYISMSPHADNTERYMSNVISQMAIAAKHAADEVYQKYMNVDNVDKSVENSTQLDIPPTTKVTTERPAFRDRLPNNVVDVAALTIENAVTENAIVRCPKCGQAHCLATPANGRIYMMKRNYEKNEFEVIAECEAIDSQDFINMCCKPDTDRKLYFNDLQAALPLEGIDLAVTNDTEVFCPVCCASSTFLEWKDAYENPLSYFETEHICDACGGEMLPKMVKGKPYQECDKCKHTTEYQEE